MSPFEPPGGGCSALPSHPNRNMSTHTYCCCVAVAVAVVGVDVVVVIVAVVVVVVVAAGDVVSRPSLVIVFENCF